MILTAAGAQVGAVVTTGAAAGVGAAVTTAAAVTLISRSSLDPISLAATGALASMGLTDCLITKLE